MFLLVLAHAGSRRTHTHTTVLRLLGLCPQQPGLPGPGEPVPEETFTTHTYRGHQSSPIYFLHLNKTANININNTAVLLQRLPRDVPCVSIRQYAHGLLLESAFVPSSTDCWAVLAKIRQNGHLGGRRGETGSRNTAATQKIERALVISYRPSIVTFPLS